MSDIAVAVHNLSKIYRLYTKPLYRFLDIFGWLRTPNAYSEHAALAGIDLDIRKGEKVAIVGRNGAGKSTLLKLICGAIEPTSGQIHINGNIHALLQIGTGFHPDFTGRENVYSYLANLGLSGRKADEKVREIIEFAELEEYIDQPMKTYSTGMGVRIMFATSTAITPDILVLDEVLGVGDGYFVQKSYERMKYLCEQNKTTLIFVTHDLYSAIKICNRCIWIDSGSILMDTDSVSVIHRYEASLRDQQEKRLRKLKMDSLKENVTVHKPKEFEPLFCQIRCTGNVPVDQEFPIKHIAFWQNGLRLRDFILDSEKICSDFEIVNEAGKGNWKVKDIDGCKLYHFSPFGSIYHRVPFIIKDKKLLQAIADNSVEVEIEFKDEAVNHCIFEIFLSDEKGRLTLPLNNCGSKQWVTCRSQLKFSTQLESKKPDFYRYGNQAFSITDVSFLNSDGEESFTFHTGGKMTIRLDYVIHDPGFNQCPVIHVSLMRDGVTRSNRFVLKGLLFDYKIANTGTLEIVCEKLMLCQGKYSVNVAVMAEGGYDQDAAQVFFTANDNLLDHHSRAYHIEILPMNNVLVDDCNVLHSASWYHNGKFIRDGCYPLDWC